MATIRKLVLPVAGMGTRLRPLTLRTPKALLVVGGRPLLDYMLEEAARSGIRDVSLVISPAHRGHFARFVASAGKKYPTLDFTVVAQERAFGNGQAILRALGENTREPIAVRYCDDILLHGTPALASLMRMYETHRAPVFVLERVPWSLLKNYGVVSVRKKVGPSLYEVHSIFEKHIVGEASERISASNLSVVGAYILTSSLIDHLRKLERVAPPVTDALLITAGFHHELASGGRVHGWEFPGKRFDCGTLEGIAKADAYLARR